MSTADPVSTVRSFLTCTQKGDTDGVRFHVTRRTAESPHFDPSPPYELTDFEVGEAVSLDDGVVVEAHMSGTEASGNPVEITMPFVLELEDGAWKIDLERSMERMFGGGGELEQVMNEAMDQMATALTDVMSGVGDALAGALGGAEHEAPDAVQIERWSAALAEALRREVALEIEIDWPTDPAIEVDMEALDVVLGRELPDAMRYIGDPQTEELMARIQRLRISFVAATTGRGLRVEGDALELVFGGEVFDTWSESTTIQLFLTMEGIAEQVEQRRELVSRLQGAMDLLAEQHNLRLTMDISWRDFGRGDVLWVAWNLYLLHAKAIEPLTQALLSILDRRPEMVAPLRERLTQIKFEQSLMPDGIEVKVEDQVLMYFVFVDEVHEDYLDADALVPRVEAALDSLLAQE